MGRKYKALVSKVRALELQLDTLTDRVKVLEEEKETGQGHCMSEEARFGMNGMKTVKDFLEKSRRTDAVAVGAETTDSQGHEIPGPEPYPIPISSRQSEKIGELNYSDDDNEWNELNADAEPVDSGPRSTNHSDVESNSNPNSCHQTEGIQIQDGVSQSSSESSISGIQAEEEPSAPGSGSGPEGHCGLEGQRVRSNESRDLREPPPLPNMIPKCVSGPKGPVKVEVEDQSHAGHTSIRLEIKALKDALGKSGRTVRLEGATDTEGQSRRMSPEARLAMNTLRDLLGTSGRTETVEVDTEGQCSGSEYFPTSFGQKEDIQNDLELTPKPNDEELETKIRVEHEVSFSGNEEPLTSGSGSKRQAVKNRLVKQSRLEKSKCDYCEKSFILIANKARHERIHTGEEPFSCALCDRRFNRKSNLCFHMSTHTTIEKPLVCTFCGKSFLHKQNLGRHIERKHAEGQSRKKYKCNYCVKSFIANADKVVHERIHTGEQPFSCAICDRRFNTKSSLKRHMKTHTKERPYRCTLCGCSFAVGWNLKTHVKKMHATEGQL